MRLHESVVPKHFTPRMRAQVCYRTFSAEQISRHEAMRAQLKANKPLTADGKPASTEDKLAFTEYCIMNDRDGLLSAFEAGRSTELIELMRDVENQRYSPSGRFLGMEFSTSSGLSWKKFSGDITARFREGLRIFELGPGMTRGAIAHAEQHGDHFVVTLEANAINIRGLYEHLGGLGHIARPLPNLRILFGDIRHMERPDDFAADLLLANLVFTPPDNRLKALQVMGEYKEMFDAFLSWADPNAALRLTPPIKNDALDKYVADVMKRPENSGRSLFFEET